MGACGGKQLPAAESATAPALVPLAKLPTLLAAQHEEKLHLSGKGTISTAAPTAGQEEDLNASVTADANTDSHQEEEPCPATAAVADDGSAGEMVAGTQGASPTAGATSPKAPRAAEVDDGTGVRLEAEEGSADSGALPTEGGGCLAAATAGSPTQTAKSAASPASTPSPAGGRRGVQDDFGCLREQEEAKAAGVTEVPEAATAVTSSARFLFSTQDDLSRPKEEGESEAAAVTEVPKAAADAPASEARAEQRRSKEGACC